MKRLGAVAAGLIWICFTLAFAAEKTPPAPPLPPRVPEMSTAGKVLEVSDKVLKIERTLKGKVETMEFSLEKSFTGLTVGDQVKVSYREKEGRNILIRVAPAKKTAVQKPKKEAAKPATPAGSQGAPAAK